MSSQAASKKRRIIQYRRCSFSLSVLRVFVLNIFVYIYMCSHISFTLARSSDVPCLTHFSLSLQSSSASLHFFSRCGSRSHTSCIFYKENVYLLVSEGMWLDLIKPSRKQWKYQFSSHFITSDSHLHTSTISKINCRISFRRMVCLVVDLMYLDCYHPFYAICFSKAVLSLTEINQTRSKRCTHAAGISRTWSFRWHLFLWYSSKTNVHE